MRAHSFLPLLALGRAVQGAALDGIRGVSPRDVLTSNALQASGHIDDLRGKVESRDLCLPCATYMRGLQAALLAGDTAFIWSLKKLCEVLTHFDDDVCDGWVGLEAPSVAAAARAMGDFSRGAQTFCSNFWSTCGYPAVEPWNITFPSPKPAGGRPEPSRKMPPLKVVHYSDIHVDPLYTPGAKTNCTKPTCCRPYTNDDAPGSNTSPAGPNGEHTCDTPLSLEASMYEAINAVASDAAFALFTGDIVDDTTWETTQAYNTASIKHAYGVMKQKLKRVYATAGTHEAHPVNLFQPSDIGNDTQWLYGLLAQEWSPWLDPAAEAQVNNFGAYSTKYPFGNLRVISINTNFYYRLNFWRYKDFDNKDVENQLEWLIKELDGAERAGENVYIIGHSPNGEPDTFWDPSHYLDQIFNRYSATIAAMFFGHTQLDQFEISYLDYAARNASNAFLTSYIAPSLAPTTGMPSFRVYSVDPETFGVLDVTTYVADMTNPAYQQTGPVWEKYYSAKEAYGPAVDPPLTDPLAELTPAFWHNLTEAFDQDQKLFDEYVARKSRGWNVTSCDGDCKKAELCQLRAGRSEDNCYDPLTDKTPYKHVDQYDVSFSVTAHTLRALANSEGGLDKLKEVVEEAKKNVTAAAK